MKTVLSQVMEISSELESYYRELLKSFNLDKMDAVVMEFEKEIQGTKGQLSNERIRYYSGMFSYYAYALSATLSRQSLRSDVAELYFSHVTAKHYVTQEEISTTKKLTREDKSALTKLQSEDEEKVKILYVRATQAIETRINAFYKLLNTLSNLGAMNMSEAKLGGKQ